MRRVVVSRHSVKKGRESVLMICAGVIPALVGSLGGKTIGYLPKDVASGKIPDEWKKAYVHSSCCASWQTGALRRQLMSRVDDCKPPIAFVDMANAISAVLSVKDGEEIVRCQYPEGIRNL